MSEATESTTETTEVIPYPTPRNATVHWKIRFFMHPMMSFLGSHLFTGDFDKPVIRRVRQPPLPATGSVYRNGVRSEDLIATVSGAPADVPVRAYWPEKAEKAGPAPVLVWFHGGGYCLGDPKDRNVEEASREFALQNDIVVVSVGYRLAPEHPWPAGVQDGTTVMRWLASDQCPESLKKSIDLSRTLLGGESAGGNLALTTAYTQIAVDAATVPITLVGLVLVYPSMLVPYTTGSAQRMPEPYMLPSSMRKWFTPSYLPNATEEERKTSPLICPLNIPHDILSQFPPSILIQAEFDPLVDEGVDYANLLLKLGRKVHRGLYPSCHGFFSFTFTHERPQALEFIKTHLQPLISSNQS